MQIGILYNTFLDQVAGHATEYYLVIDFRQHKSDRNRPLLSNTDDGAPFGNELMLAYRPHSRNNPRRSRMRKTLAKGSAIFLLNKGKNPRESVPPYESTTLPSGQA